MSSDVRVLLVAWLALSHAAYGVREPLPPKSVWPELIELGEVFFDNTGRCGSND